MVRSTAAGLLSRWFGRRKPDAELSELRARVRFLQSYNQRIKARYDAAGTNPELERYWAQADHKGPRAANDVGIRRTLRSRSRYECQESNSFARGMLVAKQNDVIGTGAMLQVTTADTGLNAAIEQKWTAWARANNLAPKLRTLHGAKVGDGEGFAQRGFSQRSRDANKLSILLTEADLWTDPFGDQSPEQCDGITYDEFGEPVSYRRLRQHPGDNIQWGNGYDTDEFDANDVIHWFRQDRPDQRRGIPEFTAALPLFAELRRYRLAVIAAAEIAADFTGVLYSDANAFSETPDESGDPFSTVDLERRTLMTLPAGWKLSQLKAEQPTTEFQRFSEAILCEIGRTAMMPLNLVAGSSREYNFASGRLDYLLYWSHCDIERSDFACRVMDRIFEWWLDEALLIPGYLPRFGEVREVPHEWIWPPRRPIDEVKAAQADAINWQMGFLTDESWAKREQTDLERHYEELQRSIERRQAMSAPVPTATLTIMQQEISQEQTNSATAGAASNGQE